MSTDAAPSTEHATEPVDPRLLPPQLRELVRLNGLPHTLRLVEARGGAPLYVGLSVEGAGVLRELLPAAAVAALVAHYAGHTLRLPKPDKITQQLRDRAIRAAHGRATKRELATLYGLTTERVRQIWREGEAAAEADCPTLPLFGADA